MGRFFDIPPKLPPDTKLLPLLLPTFPPSDFRFAAPGGPGGGGGRGLFLGGPGGGGGLLPLFPFRLLDGGGGGGGLGLLPPGGGPRGGGGGLFIIAVDAIGSINVIIVAYNIGYISPGYSDYLLLCSQPRVTYKEGPIYEKVDNGMIQT
jgi:hypothetical protein